MSSDAERPSPPISSVAQLCDYFRAGEKAPDARLVGAEHEKLPVVESTLAPADYEHGIRPLLVGLTRYGWTPVPDAERPLALERGRASITLEPGGQLELSGAPLASLHQVARELYQHLVEIVQVSEPLGLRCSTLALRPRESTAEVPWMPKARYAVMRDFLPARGRLALDMMLLTATVQANFDYVSELDFASLMRTAMAVSPVVAAISAHSPYSLGRWSGYRSRRYAVWREVDPARCGILPFVFNDDLGYRDYVEWALDVPMIFIRRGGEYRSAGGVTFRRFWQESSAVEPATMADFENHLSTLFPEVRPKRYIEVRSADAMPPVFALGVVGLWKGILYDAEARRAAFELVRDLGFTDRLAMQRAAAQDALRGHGPGWHLGELAAELLRLARGGLARQARRDAVGRDEGVFLAPLQELVDSRESLADRLVARFGAGPLDDAAMRELLRGSACQAALPHLRHVARPAGAGGS